MKAVQVWKELKLLRTNGVGRKIRPYCGVPVIQKHVKKTKKIFGVTYLMNDAQIRNILKLVGDTHRHTT